MKILKIIFFLFIFNSLHSTWYQVCLDPGHCGIKDPGAPGCNGDEEPDKSDFNLYIAQVCAEILRNDGISVILTRESEEGDI